MFVNHGLQSPAKNLTLIVQVRLYEVGANGQTQGKAMYSHQGPVLSVCWNKARLFVILDLVWFLTVDTGREQGLVRGC